MATVGQNVLSTCPVWLPTLSEQANVLKHIDEESERLDAITSRAQREISLLREYRTRLIADIVTGKLDVRAAAASLPDDTDEPEVPDDREALAEGDEDTIDGDLDVAPEEAEA